MSASKPLALGSGKSPNKALVTKMLSFPVLNQNSILDMMYLLVLKWSFQRTYWCCGQPFQSRRPKRTQKTLGHFVWRNFDCRSCFPFILHHRVRNELFSFQIKRSFRIHFVYGKISMERTRTRNNKRGRYRKQSLSLLRLRFSLPRFLRLSVTSNETRLCLRKLRLR